MRLGIISLFTFFSLQYLFALRIGSGASPGLLEATAENTVLPYVMRPYKIENDKKTFFNNLVGIIGKKVGLTLIRNEDLQNNALPFKNAEYFDDLESEKVDYKIVSSKLVRKLKKHSVYLLTFNKEINNSEAFLINAAKNEIRTYVSQETVEVGDDEEGYSVEYYTKLEPVKHILVSSAKIIKADTEVNRKVSKLSAGYVQLGLGTTLPKFFRLASSLQKTYRKDSILNSVKASYFSFSEKDDEAAHLEDRSSVNAGIEDVGGLIAGTRNGKFELIGMIYHDGKKPKAIRTSFLVPKLKAANIKTIVDETDAKTFVSKMSFDQTALGGLFKLNNFKTSLSLVDFDFRKEVIKLSNNQEKIQLNFLIKDTDPGLAFVESENNALFYAEVSNEQHLKKILFPNGMFFDAENFKSKYYPSFNKLDKDLYISKYGIQVLSKKSGNVIYRTNKKLHTIYKDGRIYQVLYANQPRLNDGAYNAKLKRNKSTTLIPSFMYKKEDALQKKVLFIFNNKTALRINHRSVRWNATEKLPEYKMYFPKGKILEKIQKKVDDMDIELSPAGSTKITLENKETYKINKELNSIISYPGRFVQIRKKDGRVVDYYPNGMIFDTHANVQWGMGDVSKFFKKKINQTIKFQLKFGPVTEVFPNGKIVYNYSDTSKKTVTADGTKKTEKNGIAWIIHPNKFHSYVFPNGVTFKKGIWAYNKANNKLNKNTIVSLFNTQFMLKKDGSVQIGIDKKGVIVYDGKQSVREKWANGVEAHHTAAGSQYIYPNGLSYKNGKWSYDAKKQKIKKAFVFKHLNGKLAGTTDIVQPNGNIKRTTPDKRNFAFYKGLMRFQEITFKSKKRPRETATEIEIPDNDKAKKIKKDHKKKGRR